MIVVSQFEPILVIVGWGSGQDQVTYVGKSQIRESTNLWKRAFLWTSSVSGS